MPSQTGSEFRNTAVNLHIISKAGIRFIVELEYSLAMSCSGPFPRNNSHIRICLDGIVSRGSSLWNGGHCVSRF